MGKLFLFVIFSILSFPCMAQDEPIILFPGNAPGELGKLTEKREPETMVGGAPIIRLTNVGTPTITVFRASGEIASGAAMIVCPGGGYSVLAYDLEGTEICQWLNTLGITAVLLKYRVPAREGRTRYAAALQDAQRAVSYVRYHAKDWGIDPGKIGIMGFSAGAHLSAMTSTAYKERTYPFTDVVDQVSCRPDFCLLVYPAYLNGENFRVAREINITPDTPPTMIIQTEDDKNYINSSLFYYYALKEAGVPAWMHLYSKGGHGYGLRNTGAEVNEWPQRVETWLSGLNLIKVKK